MESSMMDTAASKFTLITPKQLYERLNQSMPGEHIGINTIYALVRRQDFPSCKIGRKYYVIEENLADWFHKQTNKRKV